MKLKLIKCNSIVETEIYTGAMSLGDIFDQMHTPIYVHGIGNITDNESGYQREPKDARIKAISNRILAKLDKNEINMDSFVDTINLNMRNKAVSQSRLIPLEKGANDFGDVFTYEYIKTDGKFYVVDGQTRLKGAQRALAYLNDIAGVSGSSLAEKIREFKVQVSLTFTENRYDEAMTFYLINEYAKPVPPVGAQKLMYEGFKSGETKWRDEVSNKKQEPLIHAQDISEKLNKDSAVWSGQMSDYNEGPGGRATNLAVTKCVVTVLNAIERTSTAGETLERRKEATYSIIEAFYVGWKKTYSWAFDKNVSPRFSVLKAGTTEIMMGALAFIIENEKGHSLEIGNKTDPQMWHKLFVANFSDLIGTDSRTGKVKLTGIDFFLEGKSGAIGDYSNQAAKSALTKRIYDVLVGRANI